MRAEIEKWAKSVGWELGSHGNRYSVKDDGELRLICNDAPTRGYTNVFIKGRTRAQMLGPLSDLKLELIRDDTRYGGTTLHVPPASLSGVLREVSRQFGASPPPH
jgi:hypothetical protein